MSNITWIDVETTGLIAHRNHLLEIACLITDENLNILDEEGYHAVVGYGVQATLDLQGYCTSYVYNMHKKTGLWKKLNTGKPLDQIDEELTGYLSGFGNSGEMSVGGNSVRLDMNFMDEHLPGAANYLDHHMRDVSSLSGFMNEWFGIPWLEKKSDHTAMTDIRESIHEAKYYKDLLESNLKALTKAKAELKSVNMFLRLEREAAKQNLDRALLAEGGKK